MIWVEAQTYLPACSCDLVWIWRVSFSWRQLHLWSISSISVPAACQSYHTNNGLGKSGPWVHLQPELYYGRSLEMPVSIHNVFSDHLWLTQTLSLCQNIPKLSQNSECSWVHSSGTSSGVRAWALCLGNIGLQQLEPFKSFLILCWTQNICKLQNYTRRYSSHYPQANI